MRNRKSKARRAEKDELPFLAAGDGAELFIACYVTTAGVWKQQAHQLLANLPSVGLPLASGAAAMCMQAKRLLENYARAKLKAAEALEAAIDADRPGDVAMLDLPKLGIAIEAFGLMTDAYEVLAAFYGGPGKPDGLAGMAPRGHA